MKDILLPDPDSASDFKLDQFLAAPCETFDPHYGKAYHHHENLSHGDANLLVMLHRQGGAHPLCHCSSWYATMNPSMYDSIVSQKFCWSAVQVLFYKPKTLQVLFYHTHILLKSM